MPRVPLGGPLGGRRLRPDAPPAGGWGTLGLFWAAVLAVLLAGGITLQLLGPPANPAPPQAAGAPAANLAQQAVRPGRVGSGPIAPPDPALLEAVAGAAAGTALPRIGSDGRAPMQAYAAGFDAATKLPRIGVVLAGVGLDAAGSEDAIQALPAAVTLAISPYAADPNPVLAAARRAGHEYLLSIPLEPQGYPQNDPGLRALLTSQSPAQNAKALDWALARIAGYVGVTGALGALRGERFASLADQMQPMLATLAHRGLLYVDPRPGATKLPLVWSCNVDVVIDESPAADAIDARLAELERRAHDTGVAVGLVGAVHPVTIARLRAWAGNLAARGYVLAPISALVTPPPKGGAAP